MPKDTLVSFIPMESLSNDGGIIEKADKSIAEVIRGGYTYFAEGDILIAKITPCMENGKCAIASGLTNGIGFGSSEFHVFRTNEEVLTKYLFLYLNRPSVRKIAASNMTGASGHRRVPISFYENLSVPLPPLVVQEEVVAECEKVDDEYNTSRMIIEEYRTKITEVFNSLKGVDGAKLENLLVEVKGVKTKIAEDQIMESGMVPVITQESDRLIAGYTDCKEAISDLPIIVFGDHTCAFKYVDFPFVRGADGTQLLKTDEDVIMSRFLCGYLQTLEIEHAGKYERHFKYLKQMRIPVPPLSEQKQIVAEVSSYEAEITKAQAVMDSASARKQAILQKHGIILSSPDVSSSNP